LQVDQTTLQGLFSLSQVLQQRDYQAALFYHTQLATLVSLSLPSLCVCVQAMQLYCLGRCELFMLPLFHDQFWPVMLEVNIWGCAVRLRAKRMLHANFTCILHLAHAPTYSNPEAATYLNGIKILITIAKTLGC